MLGPGWNLVGKEEIDSVLEVLTSREMSRYRFDAPEAAPSKVLQFEREMAKALGVAHALGTNSCTSALLAGFAGLGIGPGDEVIVPGYTFIASAAAVAHARAVPILAEIDASLGLDPKDVEAKVTPRTRAILAVHMQGGASDLDALSAIASRHGLALVEDVAQACGGSFRGRRLGSIGAFGAFSLNVFKVITAGDGGVLAASDTGLYERAFAFHDHGAKPLRAGVADDGSLLGLNLRMHELTGAVALAQVRKLDRILAELRWRKRLLRESLDGLSGFRFRPLADEEGDCGTTLTLVFEEADLARRVAEALSTKTLQQSGRHAYGNMIQLLNRKMPTPEACPWACAAHPSAVTYRAGMLPRTDDVLSRSISLAVGVHDSYLGADFGVTILSTEDEVRAKADELRRRVKGLLW